MVDTDHHVLKQFTSKRQAHRERERDSETGLTDSDLLCKSLANLYSNNYRGNFRKPVNACEFTHVSVLMRTRLADSRFTAPRIMYRLPPGSERDRLHDLGSLQVLLIAATENVYLPL